MHQYGVTIADEKEWQDRGSNGKTVQKLKNGQTLVQTWQNGVLQGLAYTTFAHTDVICEETFYENGEPLWMATNYASGAPSLKEQYLPQGGKVVATWYEDGSPKTNEEYTDSGLFHGEYFTNQAVLEAEVVQGNGVRIHRDGYGQLQSKESIQNGQVVLQELFYPNGLPKQHTPYVNGKIEGVVKTFYPAGEPKTVEEWQNGKLDGIIRVYFNGEVIATVPYVDGVKEGIEQRFRPGTSELVEEISWKHNMRHGQSIVYVDDEKILDWYSEGQKVSKMQYLEREHAIKGI